jgi:hypothetical protein
MHFLNRIRVLLFRHDCVSASRQSPPSFNLSRLWHGACAVLRFLKYLARMASRFGFCPIVRPVFAFPGFSLANALVRNATLNDSNQVLFQNLNLHRKVTLNGGAQISGCGNSFCRRSLSLLHGLRGDVGKLGIFCLHRFSHRDENPARALEWLPTMRHEHVVEQEEVPFLPMKTLRCLGVAGANGIEVGNWYGTAVTVVAVSRHIGLIE